MIYDLVVIGAGPGGLMAAAECAEAGLSVLVLEKNDKPGRKLLSTGGGQCNLTNAMEFDQFCKNYHEKSKYAQKVISRFKPDDLCNYFEDLGVPLEVNGQGKVFPSSKKASDIVNALVAKVEGHNGIIELKSAVTRIEKKEAIFEVQTATKTYACSNVILATGGKSYPSLGTSGDGYALASHLGHSLSAPRPALAPVKTVERNGAELSGVSIANAWVSQWRSNRKLRDYTGDLLFTHEGLSGPVIMNNSRSFEAGDVLKVNFVRASDEVSFIKGMTAHLNAYGKYGVKKSLDYYDIPRRVMDMILEHSGIAPEKRCAEIAKEYRAALFKNLSGMVFTIAEVGGYEDAMVTAGGIAVEEIKPATMESRILSGLYFAGEVVDVDGITGGYNLQFAFSSGYNAAKSIIGARLE